MKTDSQERQRTLTTATYNEGAGFDASTNAAGQAAPADIHVLDHLVKHGSHS